MKDQEQNNVLTNEEINQIEVTYEEVNPYEIEAIT